MSFGQPSGPPASAKQMRELLTLLEQAGYDGFRSARGPLGFTQRQGGGKFTRDEADAVIEQVRAELEAAEGESEHESGAVAEMEVTPAEPVRPAARPARPSNADQVLRRFTSQQLAAELQRRGWVVMEP
jgi:hypothetical protein